MKVRSFGWAGGSTNFSSLFVSSPSSSNPTSGDQEVRLASDHPKKLSGRKKFAETRHLVFRGVRRKNPDRWVCELREPTRQTRIWLGTFPTAEMAARAYDVAQIALRGASAYVNFADSFSTLLIPDSTDPKVIQKAAAEAFRPPKSTDHGAFANDASTSSNTEENGSSFASDYQGDYFYMEEEDQEMDFGMPGPLLADMADGMMLPLPGFAVRDEIEFDSDIDLWNY